MATNKSKDSLPTDNEAPVEDLGQDQTTRSDVQSEKNPSVDATRVHVAQSDNRQGEEITADNAAELLTDNDIARRNREVADYGTAKDPRGTGPIHQVKE